MPFDHCAECKSCCNIEPGYPALEITLTKKETRRFGSICVQRSCTHLGPSGCTLGDDKPFGCKLYPLSYDPQNRALFYDRDCPLMPTYIRQLKDTRSEASLHLAGMRKEIKALEKSDPAFLERNFNVDTEFFDLKRLPSKP